MPYNARVSAIADNSRTLADPSQPRQLWTLSALQREVLVHSRAYRLGLWLQALLGFVYCVRLLSGAGGARTVLHGAIALGWTTVITASAFFRGSWAARHALHDLARLSGASRREWLGLGLARASLVVKPLVLGHTALWACWAWQLRSLSQLPWVIASFCASLLAVAALSACSSGLAAFSETVAPNKPARVLLILLVLPALLASVIPELPSLLDAHASWLGASVGLVASQ